jgi:hypothetical protein
MREETVNVSREFAGSSWLRGALDVMEQSKVFKVWERSNVIS